MVASPLAERRRAERRGSGIAGLEGRMRTLSPLGLVARHGVAGLRALVDAVPLDATTHYTVRP